MQTAAHPRSLSPINRVGLSASRETILHLLAFYRYLTVQQLLTLRYQPTSKTFVQETMKQLTDEGYVLRLWLPRRTRAGSVPAVYTLAPRGRRYLKARGTPFRLRFHTTEEQELSDLFLQHTLAVNDALISFVLLTRAYPGITIQRMLHDHELKRTPIVVSLPSSRNGREERIAVVPDGWLDLRYARGGKVCLALEIDRGTEAVSRWKRKALAWCTASRSGYQEVFGTRSLFVCVLATPGQRRVDELRRWTEEVLVQTGNQDRAEYFRFAHLPTEPDPRRLFLGPSWQLPFTATPSPLLVPPEEYA